MLDLSKMSNEDLMKAMNQPSAPASAPSSGGTDLSKYSNEELQRIVSQQSSTQTQTPQEQGSQIPGMIKAGVAGAANAGASLLESGVDAALWATDKLGITDPNISKEAKQNLNSDLNKNVRSGTEQSPNDTFSQAYAQHPVVGKGVEYGIDTGMLAKTTLGKLLPGAGAGVGAANLASRIGANALIGAGISGPDSANQDLGATASALLTPLGDLVTAGIAKGAKMLDLPNKINKILTPIYDKIAKNKDLSIEDRAVQSEAAFSQKAIDANNANYKAIKEMPGQVNPLPLQNAIEQLGKDTGSVKLNTNGKIVWNHDNSSLSDPQKKALLSIWQDASKMKNMEDAVILRQQIAGTQSLFRGAGVSKTAFNGFSDLKDKIDNAIGKIAEQNGLKGNFDFANNFNRNVIQPLNEAGSIDRLGALASKQRQEAFNQQQAATGKAIQAPTPPEYTKATKQIFTTNMTPQQVKGILSRMDGNGRQVMEDKFIQDMFKDVVQTPEDFNKNAVLLKVNQTINKYKDVLSDETLKTFGGIKTLLQQAGAEAKKTGMNNDTYFQHTLGALIGGGLGSVIAGPVGGGIGVAAGIGLLPKVLGKAGSFAQGLLDTPRGHALLKYIESHPNMAKKILQPLIQTPAASTSTKKD